MRIIFCLLLLVSTATLGQKKLDRLLKKYNTNSVPYISVEDLSTQAENVFLLDSREPKEFEISRIKNAICVGHDKFNINKTLKKLPKDKNTKIVVYCSLGIRSEDIAEQISKAGYKNVFNLYGGIFEWKNKNQTVVNSKEKTTENVHAFNKEWGKWLRKGVKVYE